MPIEVQVEIVDASNVGLLLMRANLVQIPFHERHAAVCGAVGTIDAVVERRSKQIAIPQSHRLEDARRRSVLLHGGCVVDGAFPDYIVANCLQVHIPMRRIPHHRFVFEGVVTHVTQA